MRYFLDKYMQVPMLGLGLAYHLYTRQKRNQRNNRIGLSFLEKKICLDHKNSDTVFILGSGSSINRISDKYWNIISANDSIGLNFWILHDFVPTMFKYEFPLLYNNMVQLFFSELNNKWDKYSKVLHICNNKNYDNIVLSKINKHCLMRNIYFPDYLTVPGYSELSLCNSIKLIDRVISHRKMSTLLYKRSSLTIILSLAQLMGYDNIVLCGVDLNNSGYFYDDNYYKSKYTNTFSDQKSSVHLSYNSSVHPLTIDKIIDVYQEVLFKPKNINLYVMNKDSALYPLLPAYD